MAPACALAKQSQTFAIPVNAPITYVQITNSEGKNIEQEDVPGYLQVPKMLVHITNKLVADTGLQDLPQANVAIVEEPCTASTTWWLVFTRVVPMKLHEAKSWLAKRLPEGSTLDPENLAVVFSPWLKCRLGWGDSRHTPGLVQPCARRHCRL